MLRIQRPAPHPQLPALVCVAMTVLLLSGCAGPAASGSNASPTPLASLALAADLRPVRPGARETGPPASWQLLASDTDASDDHGRGPAYADITAVGLSDADEQLRLTVTVAQELPGTLADREAERIGVDFYQSRWGMSDNYQVILEGGTRGWRAFLRTPDGYVAFPGSFTIQGPALSVVVPWDSVGGRERVDVSAFADWSLGVEGLSTDGTAPIRLGLD